MLNETVQFSEIAAWYAVLLSCLREVTSVSITILFNLILFIFCSLGPYFMFLRSAVRSTVYVIFPIYSIHLLNEN